MTAFTIWESIIVTTDIFNDKKTITLLRQWISHKLLNSEYTAYLISNLILDKIYQLPGIAILLNLNYILHVDCKMLTDSSQAIGGSCFNY